MFQEKGRKTTSSIEEGIDASIKRLEDEIEKYGEGLITVTRNHTDNTKTYRTKITKRIIRKRQISNISHEKI